MSKNKAKWFITTGIIAFVCCALSLTCALSIYIGVDMAYNPDWSTKDQIAFECSYLNMQDYFGVYGSQDFPDDLELRDICLIDSDGSNLHRLTSNRNNHLPTWSPDGELLAWLYGNNRIVVWDSTTKETSEYFTERPLSYYDFYEVNCLIWSDDGKNIILPSNSALLNLEKKQFSYNATDHIPNVSCTKALSPDKTILAWARYDNSRIFLQQLNIGKTTDLIFLDNLNGYRIYKAFGVDRLEWSPDGKNLAYTEFDRLHILELKRQDNPFLFLMVNHVSIERNVSFINIGYNFPTISWSPDSKAVVYGIPEGKIRILNLDGSWHDIAP